MGPELLKKFLAQIAAQRKIRPKFGHASEKLEEKWPNKHHQFFKEIFKNMAFIRKIKN